MKSIIANWELCRLSNFFDYLLVGLMFQSLLWTNLENKIKQHL